eukprot:Hpha_TRINITY_DN15076_c5_g5::TRINITY_DN15076_c5_g5_i1::g.124934::m.124934
MAGLLLFASVDPKCAGPSAGEGSIPLELDPSATVEHIIAELKKTDSIQGEVVVKWQGARLPPHDLLADVGLGAQCTVLVVPRFAAVNDEGVVVKLGRRAIGMSSDGSVTFYCGRHFGRQALPRSDGRCGPNNGPQCLSCKRFQSTLRNDEDAKIERGGLYLDKLYCGRLLAVEAAFCPDARCGESCGWCASCERFVKVNSDGEGEAWKKVKLGRKRCSNRFYCGRHFGSALPRSDGYCGPNNGPQCRSCTLFQNSGMCNDEGAKMGPYCGRLLGVEAAPRSDARCGPDALWPGPNSGQCASCHRFVSQVRSDDDQDSVSSGASILAIEAQLTPPRRYVDYSSLDTPKPRRRCVIA